MLPESDVGGWSTLRRRGASSGTPHPRAGRRRRTRSDGPGSGGACAPRAVACRTSISASRDGGRSVCSRRPGTRDETGEQGIRGRGAEDQGEQPEEQSGERDRDRRRHHQPKWIVRVVVVNAVDDEVELVATSEARLPVEDQPVQPVLGQSPDQEAGGEQADRRQRALAGVEPAQTQITMTGTKMIAGTLGWTLEKKSRNRFSNSGGDAASRRCVRAPYDNYTPSTCPVTPGGPSRGALEPSRSQVSQKAGKRIAKAGFAAKAAALPKSVFAVCRLRADVRVPWWPTPPLTDPERNSSDREQLQTPSARPDGPAVRRSRAVPTATSETAAALRARARRALLDVPAGPARGPRAPDAADTARTWRRHSTPGSCGHPSGRTGRRRRLTAIVPPAAAPGSRRRSANRVAVWSSRCSASRPPGRTQGEPAVRIWSSRGTTGCSSIAATALSRKLRERIAYGATRRRPDQPHPRRPRSRPGPVRLRADPRSPPGGRGARPRLLLPPGGAAKLRSPGRALGQRGPDRRRFRGRGVRARRRARARPARRRSCTRSRTSRLTHAVGLNAPGGGRIVYGADCRDCDELDRARRRRRRAAGRGDAARAEPESVPVAGAAT